MYPKILLAVDGSEHSLRATTEAIKLVALQQSGEIEVVFVADFGKSRDEVLRYGNIDELELYRRQKLFPIEELLQQQQAEYVIKMLHGEPGQSLIRHANDHAFDLVVMGSRGLGSLKEMVLGSVSHKVARGVKCPVLIVK